MKKLIPSICLLIFPYLGFTQYGIQSFGPSAFQKVIASHDNNFYLLGTKEDSACWLIKISPNQQILWEKTFLGPKGQHTQPFRIQVEKDGTILIIGLLHPFLNSSNSTGWMILLNSNGETILNREIPEVSVLLASHKLITNKYLLAGPNVDKSNGEQSLLLEVDKNGNQVLLNSIFYYQTTRIEFIDQLSDGSLILVGRASNSFNYSENGIFVIRQNVDGSEILKKFYSTNFTINSYSRSNYYFSLNVAKNNNGNYIITDYINNGDILLLEFDIEGKYITERIIDNLKLIEHPHDIINLQDGNYLICGETYNHNNIGFEYLPYALKITRDGKPIWHKLFNKIGFSSYLLSVAELENGELFFAGSSVDPYAILYRTNSLGEIYDKKIIGKAIYDINSNCKIDSSDLVLKNVIIRNVFDPNEFGISNNKGEFIIKSGASISRLKAIAPNEFIKACNIEQEINIDQSTNIGEANFLFSPIDLCSHVTVSITQADFQKCKTSKNLILVKNYGAIASQPMELTIQYDNRLKLFQYSSGGVSQENTIKYFIPSLNSLEELNFEIHLNLDCNILIGSSHLITASLNDEICGTSWNGPNLVTQSTCNGEEVQIQIKNVGSNMTKPVKYKTYLNQFLNDENEFTLNKDEVILLNYPTFGNTVFMKIDDPNKVLQNNKYVYVFEEACGTNSIGQYAVGYANTYLQNNKSEKFAYVLSENSSGTSNRIQESIKGLGNSHFISKKEWMEYTIQFQNNLTTRIDSLELNLFQLSNLNLSSLQFLNTQGELDIKIKDSSTINIKITNIKLEPRSSSLNKDIFLKLRLKLSENPRKGNDDNILIGLKANVILQDTIVYDLIPGINYLIDSTQFHQAKSYNYDKDISIIGGRYSTTALSSSVSDLGDLFILMHSNSFGHGYKNNPLLLKLNNESKSIWMNTIDSLYINGYLSDVAYSYDGGCALTGFIYPNKPGPTIQETKVAFIKINHDGKIDTSTFFYPGLQNFGGEGSKIIQTKDSNFLITGTCKTGINGSDHFVAKLSQEAELVWLKQYAIHGLVFDPSNIVELDNGEIITTGHDDNRDLLCILKTNADGDKIWMKTITPQLSHSSYGTRSIINRKEEIIFIQGGVSLDPSTLEYRILPHIITLDKSGILVEEKILYKNLNKDINTSLILQDKIGNYIIAGSISNKEYYSTNFFIGKLDSNFNEIWYKSFGNNRNEDITSIAFDQNGNLHAIGNSQDTSFLNNQQIVYLKIDTLDYSFSNVSSFNSNKLILSVYPTPTQDKIKLLAPEKLDLKDCNWNLINLQGEKIEVGKLNSSYEIDLGHVRDGIYILSLDNYQIPPIKVVISKK